MAKKVLGLPVRIAKPEKMVGLTDQISSPAFATSVGLLQWAILMSETNPQTAERTRGSKTTNINWESVKEFFRKLIP
jgi:cell division protein FtsA